MIGDRFPGAAFLPVMGLVVGAFPVGVGLVELTHGPVVRALGWPGLFIAGAAISAVALILFLAISERPRPGADTAWALPSRHECALVAVAGIAWTAYNAWGYYGFLSYMPSLMAASRPPAGRAGAGADAGHLAESRPPPSWAARWRHGSADRPVFMTGTIAGIVAVAGPAAPDWPAPWGCCSAPQPQSMLVSSSASVPRRPAPRTGPSALLFSPTPSTCTPGGAFLPASRADAPPTSPAPPAGALVAAAARPRSPSPPLCCTGSFHGSSRVASTGVSTCARTEAASWMAPPPQHFGPRTRRRRRSLSGRWPR